MRRRIAFPALLAVWSFLAAASAAAQNLQELFEAVPGQAFGFAFVQRVDQANAKIAQLAKLVGAPEAPDVWQFAKGASGFREGLNDQGSLAVAVLPGEDGAPTPVVFVPVSDYGALVKQLGPADPEARIIEAEAGGEEILLARKDDFAVVAAPDGRAALEGVLEAEQGIAQRVAPLRDFLAQADAGGVLLEAGLNLLLRTAVEQLESVKEELAKLGEQGETAAAGIDMYISLAKAADRYVTHFAVAVRVEESGAAHIRSRTLVKPEAGLADIAATTPKADAQLFAGLPGGDFVFAGGGGVSSSWMDQLMRLSFGVMRGMPGGEALSDEDLQQITDIYSRSMQGVRSMAMVLGAPQAGEPLYANLVMAIRSEDAQQYLKNYRQAMEAMEKLGDLAKKLPYYGGVQVEETTVAGQPALKITTALPGVFDQPEAAEQKRLLETMLGGDKMIVYQAAADETTTIVAYLSRDKLAELLEAARTGAAGLADDPLLAKTASLLPDDAHAVGYLSPRGMFQFARSMMAAAGPPGLPALPIPEFPATPPVGFAVVLSAGSVDTDLVVPGEVLKAVGDLIAQLRQPAS